MIKEKKKTICRKSFVLLLLKNDTYLNVVKLLKKYFKYVRVETNSFTLLK